MNRKNSNEVLIKAKAAKEASSVLTNLDTRQKNAALSKVAKNIIRNTDNIIKVNKIQWRPPTSGW